MVRALSGVPRDRTGCLDRGDQSRQLGHSARLVVVFVLAVISGCAIVPRARMDECEKLSQALRADNARLKDRLLALQGQNRDFAERAVDDAGRLAIQDEALERLEHSVQAYQDERARLEAAYKQLASNLGVDEREAGNEQVKAGSRVTRSERTGSPASAPSSKIATGIDGATPR
jgi:hypothetical protein